MVVGSTGVPKAQQGLVFPCGNFKPVLDLRKNGGIRVSWGKKEGIAEIGLENAGFFLLFSHGKGLWFRHQCQPFGK
jgi:hypothetical protein